MSARRTRTLRRSSAAVAVAATLLASPGAFAEDGWLVRGAFEAGGDKLTQANFTNGDAESIKAGGELHIEIGARRGFGGPAWETDLSVGYKFDSANADNGDISFNRITLNAIQYYRYSEQIRIGAGVTYHLNPELEIDVPNGFGGRLEGTGEADDALGFMLGADYLVAERVELGVRATQIDYEFTTGDMLKVDGNSVGGYVTYRF